MYINYQNQAKTTESPVSKEVRRMKEKGFTLIELMTVIAILGILAAVAIPMYMNYQNKGRTAEVAVNIAGIKDGIESTYSSAINMPLIGVVKVRDAYLTVASAPGTWVTGAQAKAKTDWVAAEVQTWGAATHWTPKGASTYAQYGVTVCGVAAMCATIGGQTDVDGDGASHVWVTATVSTANPTIIGTLVYPAVFGATPTAGMNGQKDLEEGGTGAY